MKTKLTVVIKENRRREQVDEGILPTTAYKFFAPIHDLIMRLDTSEDSKKPQWAKDLIEWYKDNDYTQMVGNAFLEWEKSMKDLWDSGKEGKLAVATLNALDVSTIASTPWSMLLKGTRDRWIKEEEEKQEKIAKEMKDMIEKEEYEKSAQRTVEKQEEIIAAQKRQLEQFAEERAASLLGKAKQAREALAQIAQSHGHSASQEKMYTSSLNEDKKMTKKYSSFKQQQTITENFRRFISEDDRYEGEYDQAAARGAGAIPDGEQKIIDYIRNKEFGTLENNSDDEIVNIENLTDDAAWKVLNDEGIFYAINKDERVTDHGYKDDDIGTAIQNWINDRGLTPDGDIDYPAL